MAWALLSSETIDDFAWFFASLQTFGLDKDKIEVIFTDRDHAMAAAIEKCLPGSAHRLCIWHVCENIATNVKNCFDKQEYDQTVRSFLQATSSRDIVTFDRRWKRLVDHVRATQKSTKAETYFEQLYLIKQQIAAYGTLGRVTLGMLSSQRAETINAMIKGLIGTNGTVEELAMTLQRLLRNVSAKQQQQLQKISILPAEFRNDSDMRDVAKDVSAQIFDELVQTVRNATSTFRANKETREVCMFANGSQHVVATIDESSLCSLGCTQEMKMPCAHLVALRIALGEKCLTVDDIDDRWRLTSDDPVIPVLSTLKPAKEIKVPETPNKHARYGVLFSQFKRIVNVVQEDAKLYTEAYKQLHNFADAMHASLKKPALIRTQ